MTELLSKPQEVDVASTTGGLTNAWFAAFRVHQAFEVRCVFTVSGLSVAVSCAWCRAYWWTCPMAQVQCNRRGSC